MRMQFQNKSNIIFLIIVLLVCCSLVVVKCKSGNDDEKVTKRKWITLILTVADSIQTYDPWNTGTIQYNEWAKPIYRIWLDMNGDPSDGAWDNGQGPRQAEIWLDNGNLGFKWNGPDSVAGTADDVEYSPITKTGATAWSQAEISGNISADGHSLQVQFPIQKIGSPNSLEVSFMTSPWTTSASDNLGSGANSTPCWIVIANATTVGTHPQSDDIGDNSWPNLTPNKDNNFDLVNAEVKIEEK